MPTSRSLVPGLTIDGPTSRDLDDAVWVAEDADGWAVTVSIADVASVVRPGTSLDAGARARAATRYLAGEQNVPMIPHTLAERWLSLLPGVSRRTLTLSARVTPALEVRDVAVTPTRLASAARLAYPDVPSILATPAHPHHKVILAANRLARALLTERRKAGALALYDLNAGLLTTEEGTVVSVPRAWVNGQSLIAELMILANRAFADWAIAREIPVLFRNHTARVHAPPREELLADLTGLAGAGEQDVQLLRERVHRTLNRADYSPVLRGHYGLALPAYLHGTSPIRRYTDLITHRQIGAYLRGAPLPHSAEELGEIAAGINAVLTGVREETENRYRARAYAPVERALDKGRPLHTLPLSDLEKAVKLASTGPCPPTLRDALCGRLRTAEALPPLLAALVCFGTPAGDDGWRVVRRAVMGRLVVHPAEAKSALTIGKDRGLVDGLAVEEREPGRTVPPFTIRLLTKVAAGPWITAPTRKLAEQRAAGGLVAHLTGLPQPFASEERDPAAPGVSVKAKTPAASPVENPIGYLLELVTSTGEAPPTYEEAASGPPHAPSYTVTARFRAHTATGTASTKKAAKTTAARALVRQIG